MIFEKQNVWVEFNWGDDMASWVLVKVWFNVVNTKTKGLGYSPI
jgi:hypothetical protein